MSYDPDYDAWESLRDPIIQLGNAWITFGDQIWDQVSIMATAEFNVTNGAWTSDSSTAFSDGFSSLQQSAQSVAEGCWTMGEVINYYVLLRDQQEATEAKQVLIQELLGIFSVLLGAIPFVDFLDLLGLLADIADVIAQVVSKIASAIAEMSSFLSRVDTVVLNATKATLEFFGMNGNWATVTANVAMDFSKFAIEYTAVNAAMVATAYGIARVPITAQDLSPVPNGAADGMLAGMFLLGRFGGITRFAGSVSKDGAEAFTGAKIVETFNLNVEKDPVQAGDTVGSVSNGGPGDLVPANLTGRPLAAVDKDAVGSTETFDGPAASGGTIVNPTTGPKTAEALGTGQGVDFHNPPVHTSTSSAIDADGGQHVGFQGATARDLSTPPAPRQAGTAVTDDFGRNGTPANSGLSSNASPEAVSPRSSVDTGRGDSQAVSPDVSRPSTPTNVRTGTDGQNPGDVVQKSSGSAAGGNSGIGGGTRDYVTHDPNPVTSTPRADEASSSTSSSVTDATPKAATPASSSAVTDMGPKSAAPESSSSVTDSGPRAATPDTQDTGAATGRTNSGADVNPPIAEAPSARTTGDHEANPARSDTSTNDAMSNPSAKIADPTGSGTDHVITEPSSAPAPASSRQADTEQTPPPSAQRSSADQGSARSSTASDTGTGTDIGVETRGGSGVETGGGSGSAHESDPSSLGAQGTLSHDEELTPPPDQLTTTPTSAPTQEHGSGSAVSKSPDTDALDLTQRPQTQAVLDHEAHEDASAGSNAADSATSPSGTESSHGSVESTIEGDEPSAVAQPRFDLATSKVEAEVPSARTGELPTEPGATSLLVREPSAPYATESSAASTVRRSWTDSSEGSSDHGEFSGGDRARWWEEARPSTERHSPWFDSESGHSDVSPRSSQAHSDTPPADWGSIAGGDGVGRWHDDDAAGGPRFEAPAAPDRDAPNGPGRQVQWEDAKVEIQQHFTDRFDYTVKTEHVADEAEEHFQEALTDRGIERSRSAQDVEDLSQAGRDKVLDDFQTDAKAAFDDRFGTPGDSYDTAVDHAAAFRGDLQSLARELPARLDREALWEEQRGLMQQRFDEAFDSHPAVMARRELLGTRGTEGIETQRNEAWQRLEPELRNAFDEATAHVSAIDQVSAVSERFDGLLRKEVPIGIGLHDRLLTEVSAGHAATGEEGSAAGEAVEQRITSEFESVFGKPFAARPGDGWLDRDDFSANDRWEGLKRAQQADWLPKAVALDRELGPGFGDRFAEAVGSHAAPRAELGLDLERPIGNTEHGLAYDSGVARLTEIDVDVHDVDLDDVANLSATAPKRTEEWLPGRDVSDAGLERVRSVFAGELSGAFREHFDGPMTADPGREAAWQVRREALFNTRLPKLLDYEAAYERQLTHASRDFEDSFEQWQEDFANGHLDDAGIERVRAQFDDDFRDAYDQIHGVDAEQWEKFGGPEQAWQTVSRRLLGSAEQRLEAEEALVGEVRRGADRFDRLGGEFRIEDEHAAELGSAYRSDTATRYDQVYGDGTRDVTAWLEHEKEHGDAFGTRLTNLSDQREAAAAARAEAEAEHEAADAARSAEANGSGEHGEDTGQQSRETHEKAPSETGPEKLRRLSAENSTELEGDAQQLAQLWREEGHADAAVEQATKAWTDTVRREFSSLHSGLADDGRVLGGRNWGEKYDNLLDVGKSDQWIGAHEQFGDAMSVLEDGLRLRAEEWSGSRYADWQREQLAGAGEQLANAMRYELSKQLRYLQNGPVDAVANAMRRQWTADAIAKAFDDVLARLERNEHTSPVLMATLTQLRTDTVSTVDAPGHAAALHPDEGQVPEASGASQAEQWQQERTQLDAKYAEQLNVLAKLEARRPDADTIFRRIIEAERDRRYGGLDEYEQMLPDSAEFRQAFDKTFDQTFAPLVRARSSGGDRGSMLTEQRWDERRELLQNSLVSRVRIAAKHVELAEQADRTAQATRERWISEQTADEKAVDQVLESFHTNQDRLFSGTYRRLDANGEIDVNAPYRYQDAYRSLVNSLDKQLTAAVAQDSAGKAANARYDEIVDAWRESHGPALSSFEPGLTIVAGHPSPEAEFALDREAQFDAAFAAQAASVSARHLNRLRMEMVDAVRSAEAHQASYAATARARGAEAAFKRKLDLEGRFVEALPRLRDGIAEALRTGGGLDGSAARSLLKTSIARAELVFQRAARRAGDVPDTAQSLQRELDDVITGTQAVAEFQTAVAEHVKAFAESSAYRIPAAARAAVVKWAHGAAAAKFDQLVASGQRPGDARTTALDRRLREVLTEIDERLEFEAGAHKAIASATEQVTRIAAENLRAVGSALAPDSMRRLRLQHIDAAQQAADRVRDDLAAHHFEPERTRQAIEELDDTLQRLIGGVREQLLVDNKLAAALTEAGNRFAALAGAHPVPLQVFAGAAQDYRRDYLTALIRTSDDKPLDAASWLEHESAAADRFGSALRPFREVGPSDLPLFHDRAPVSGDVMFLVGSYDRNKGQMYFAGFNGLRGHYSAEALARAVKADASWRATPRPVVLLAGGANDGAMSSLDMAQYAWRSAFVLKQPVVIARGSLVQGFGGEFYAGTAYVDDGGRLSLLAATQDDEFEAYFPAGTRRRLGSALGSALWQLGDMLQLGISVQPSTEKPDLLTLWNHDARIPPRRLGPAGDTMTQVEREENDRSRAAFDKAESREAVDNLTRAQNQYDGALRAADEMGLDERRLAGWVQNTREMLERAAARWETTRNAPDSRELPAALDQGAAPGPGALTGAVQPGRGEVRAQMPASAVAAPRRTQPPVSYSYDLRTVAGEIGQDEQLAALERDPNSAQALGEFGDALIVHIRQQMKADGLRGRVSVTLKADAVQLAAVGPRIAQAVANSLTADTSLIVPWQRDPIRICRQEPQSLAS